MKFIYDTGIRHKLFHHVRLRGSWDSGGRRSEAWTEQPMRQAVAPDGAVVFEAEVELDVHDVGRESRGSVLHDGPLGFDREGVVTEQHGSGHDALHRVFVLTDDPRQEERYSLTHVRRLGARKVRPPNAPEPGLRFA